MIGDNYWATGITLRWRNTTNPQQQWSATLDFLDDGFCDNQSTEGTLHTRYLLPTPGEALDLLKADAERLGIKWSQHDDDAPSIYYEGDGEDTEWPPPPNLFDILTAEARRIGWRTYERDYWTKGNQ